MGRRVLRVTHASPPSRSQQHIKLIRAERVAKRPVGCFDALVLLLGRPMLAMPGLIHWRKVARLGEAADCGRAGICVADARWLSTSFHQSLAGLFDLGILHIVHHFRWLDFLQEHLVKLLLRSIALIPSSFEDLVTRLLRVRGRELAWDGRVWLLDALCALARFG